MKYVERICRICNNKYYGDRRGSLCKNKECRTKAYQHTPETKLVISNKRKQYLKENPDKHPWKRNDKYKSEPCEKLKQILKEKHLNFIEEWQPLEDRFYSIDIAFPDLKIGIEVNGNQHYNNDGTLKSYYQERHDAIVNNGWKLIELHYSTCYNEKILDDVLNFKTEPDYTQYFIEKQNKKKVKERLPRGRKQTIKYEANQKEKIELIKNSDIDFSKFGWVKVVSKILNIPHQKVGKWLKRFLPDIYEKAFKRKMSV